MASSMQTLIKIMTLEQQKGYQNKAVIGGFARFAQHWAREANSQAQTDAAKARVTEIVSMLNTYELAAEAERPTLLQAIINLASQAEETAPRRQQARPAAKDYAPAADAPYKRPASGKPARPQGRGGDDRRHIDEESTIDDFDIVGDIVSEWPNSVAVQALSVRERRAYHTRKQTRPVALSELDIPLSQAKGIGEKRVEMLRSLGLATLRDLIFFFPRRHDDYSRMKTIRQLRPGETVTVLGTLERIKAYPTLNGGKMRIEAYLKDETGYLRLNWFNQPWLLNQLQDGAGLTVCGSIEQFGGKLQMNAPEFEPLDQDTLYAGKIVPVYRLTKGLGTKTIRSIMHEVVDTWAAYLPDHLPLNVREQADLMDFGDAVAQLHFPESLDDLEDAKYRLAFDEVFSLHLLMLQRKAAWQGQQGLSLAVSDAWLEDALTGLPFELTNAQAKALAQIRQDIAAEVPMNRLLQGDVGSGKTVIAAIAAGMAAANGAQAAVMAPTSILAEQHFKRFQELLSGLPGGQNITVALLTGKLSAAAKAQVYQGLADGSINVVVGTHAVIQEAVSFAKLGLVIIDEQHRFGAGQRGALREKGGERAPHLLVMTATPIPRTLALTLHADLDLSIIDELPPGRQPVVTRIVQAKERQRSYEFIRAQVRQGRQAYIIYPLIDESDTIEAKAAADEYARLQKDIFPELSLGLLHGRMSGVEKEAVMDAFNAGETHILISTTVIEVGIDVPNATVMMIEGANRFGLAQLHQLRGRVGRGEHRSYCLLLSDKNFLDTDERLEILEQTDNGFVLAQKDYELRGPGDLLGKQQSGFNFSGFTLSKLADPRLIEEVQREAKALFEDDPYLQQHEHAALRAYIQQMNPEWGDIS